MRHDGDPGIDGSAEYCQSKETNALVPLVPALDPYGLRRRDLHEHIHGQAHGHVLERHIFRVVHTRIRHRELAPDGPWFPLLRECPSLMLSRKDLR